jgi:hypothetical protein
LAAFNRGNPMGRVFRVIAAVPVPVYDSIRRGIPPMVIDRLLPGALVVAFDDPGQMREVITARETFGYIDNSVKLVQLENVIPAEIYDPKSRAAIEASLPPLGAVATSARQIFIAAVFVVVLAAMLAAFLKFAR